jgi:hypothetical protein
MYPPITLYLAAAANAEGRKKTSAGQYPRLFIRKTFLTD